MWIPASSFARHGYFAPVNNRRFLVVLGDMNAWTDDLKIFNSVISLYSVLVMYLFSVFKFPTNSFFNHMSMFKNSLTTNINSNVAVFSERWLVPNRCIESFVSIPSVPMQLTKVFRSAIPNFSFAVINRTNHTQ